MQVAHVEGSRTLRERDSQALTLNSFRPRVTIARQPGEGKESAVPRRIASVLALAGALLALAATASAAPSDYVSPIFGLTTGGHHALFVADAGQGIVRLKGDEALLWASLPGVTDVARRTRRSLWATTSGENDNKWLWKVRRGHAVRIADLFAFEQANNPHPAEVDSNPFDVEKLGDRRAVVADAAGNDLILVRRDGRMRLVAVLPDEVVSTDNAKSLAGCPDPENPDFAFACDLPAEIPAEAVPTSVVVRPNAFFVSELKGFPAPLGESRVWRIDRDARGVHCGESPKCRVVIDGLTSIIDLRWHDGSLYAAQIDDASWLAVETGQVTGGSVHACNVRTGNCQQVVSGQPILTAITLRRNGSIWGAINALIPGQADVVRLR
jgi:hypothetical protein